MKTKKIKLLILLSSFFFAGNFSSKAQSCIGFNDTTFQVTGIPVIDTTYGVSPDFTLNNVGFRVKYNQASGFMLTPGGYSVSDTTTGSSNYYDIHPNADKGVVWLYNTAIEMNFQGLGYVNKKIKFDLVSNPSLPSPSVNSFNVNGAGLNNLPTGINYSYIYEGLNAGGDATYSVEITGLIQTIEFAGYETGFDNLCIEQLTTPVNNCTDFVSFNDTTFQVTGIPVIDTTYGVSPDFTLNNVDFRVKYKQASGFMLTPGGYSVSDTTTGSSNYYDIHPNVDKGVVWLYNTAIEMNFQGLGYVNKKIKFDLVSNPSLPSPSVNSFNVNGAGLNNLPIGINYSYIYEGLNAGGDATYSVEITGLIQTIEFAGYETGFDNLCIEDVTDSNNCNLIADFTYLNNDSIIDFQSICSISSNITHNWDLGDGSYEYQTSFSHSYANSGTYYVTLFVIDSSTMCSDSITKVVTVSLPGANAVFSPTQQQNFTLPCNGSNVTIYDQNGVIVKTIPTGVLLWDGKNNLGNDLPTGTYYIQCGANNTTTVVTLFR